jgi:hypothetical protein
MAVMSEAFRISFPVEHDLPAAMSDLLARLAALESQPGLGAVAPGKSRSAENNATPEPQMA